MFYGFNYTPLLHQSEDFQVNKSNGETKQKL